MIGFDGGSFSPLWPPRLVPSPWALHMTTTVPFVHSLRPRMDRYPTGATHIGRCIRRHPRSNIVPGLITGYALGRRRSNVWSRRIYLPPSTTKTSITNTSSDWIRHQVSGITVVVLQVDRHYSVSGLQVVSSFINCASSQFHMKMNP